MEIYSNTTRLFAASSRYSARKCASVGPWMRLTTSLASSVGSALAGVIFGAYGFSGLAGAAGVAVAVGLVLTVLWVPRAPAAS